jgi:hypothetical protein
VEQTLLPSYNIPSGLYICIYSLTLFGLISPGSPVKHHGIQIYDNCMKYNKCKENLNSIQQRGFATKYELLN